MFKISNLEELIKLENKENHYRQLGLERSANADKIEERYAEILALVKEREQQTLKIFDSVEKMAEVKKLADYKNRLNLAYETLNNLESKKEYDKGLEPEENTQVVIQGGEEKGRSFVALVPLKEIKNDFFEFAKKQAGIKDPNLKGDELKEALQKKGYSATEEHKKDGSHVLTLHFPDKKAADKFIEMMLGKGSARRFTPEETQKLEPAKERKQEETYISPRPGGH